MTGGRANAVGVHFVDEVTALRDEIVSLSARAEGLLGSSIGWVLLLVVEI